MSSLRALGWLSGLLAVSVTLFPVPAHGQSKPKRERDVIARDELVDADSKFPDLYDAIKHLRPHMLERNRGPRTTGIQPGAAGAPMCNERLERNCSARTVESTVVPAVVYIDDAKYGDPESLRGLRTIDVDEVRYRNPNQAASDFGLGHEGGAILVKRHKSGI